MKSTITLASEQTLGVVLRCDPNMIDVKRALSDDERRDLADAGFVHIQGSEIWDRLGASSDHLA